MFDFGFWNLVSKMGGNKEEALKCLKIARQAIEFCDRVRAQRFITKAQLLDPSLSTADILSKLNDRSAEPSTKHSHARPRARVSEPGSSSAASLAYTEEHIAIVREIKAKKNYYEILGVEENSTVEDIRKAYRKLAFKVHPDKNKAPGADEAFAAVSKAFKCLSSDESRTRYNQMGSESDEQAFERHAAREAEEFYNSPFVFGEIFYLAVFLDLMRGRHRHIPLGKTLTQVLPVLLILIWSCMPSNYPVYTLSPQGSHRIKFTTQKGVDFYAKSGGSFEQAYPPDSPQRVKLEAQVERDYVSRCVDRCMVEVEFLQAGYRGDTPYCDLLKQFEALA
ncbi:hypothetical protein RHSIM_Rhsim07G0188800 [Rhododendron simsii]|uniref:J domain-containing protein n=1 Tax=Rhododendron simsii TaxID=118357 RepID=A0A834GXS1_RHOSS|nr:hypothetical protein RHSIM_Rhsim07G0188800 [Rhododendron simsii]